MWITMCVNDFRKNQNVNNSVENSTSYPQVKNKNVDNLVIHKLSTAYPQGLCG